MTVCSSCTDHHQGSEPSMGSDQVCKRSQEVFPCHTFDLGDGNQASFLKSDVAIECYTADHAKAKLLAYVAIITYPAFLLASNAMMLFTARSAIVHRRPTRFAKALSFLHAEYTPTNYAWEVRTENRRCVPPAPPQSSYNITPVFDSCTYSADGDDTQVQLI